MAPRIPQSGNTKSVFGHRQFLRVEEFADGWQRVVLRGASHEPADAEEGRKADVKLLTEIRDLLAPWK
jgi:hypothetical protein